MGIPGRGICLEIIADLGMARRDYVANTKRPSGNLRMKIFAENQKGPHSPAPSPWGMGGGTPQGDVGRAP